VPHAERDWSECLPAGDTLGGVGIARLTCISSHMPMPQRASVAAVVDRCKVSLLFETNAFQLTIRNASNTKVIAGFGGFGSKDEAAGGFRG
jgi:hypothetical protein